MGLLPGVHVHFSVTEGSCPSHVSFSSAPVAVDPHVFERERVQWRESRRRVDLRQEEQRIWLNARMIPVPSGYQGL